ncbi:MAG: hypothetical protein CL561_11905 [Alphaproteobacteria bacterium]|nr:hypothetical protein [Alphaproteobacteria bacterium]|tara:strand:- start:790 stop:984 length:195 start_codon:yes stop_codon:yes gene_type:complete
MSHQDLMDLYCRSAAQSTSQSQARRREIADNLGIDKNTSWHGIAQHITAGGTKVLDDAFKPKRK